MAVYPFYDTQQETKATMANGNFALWYNKFIPIMNFDSCKASDERGNKDSAVDHYHNKYKQFMKDPMIQRFLDMKHNDQKRFCDAFSSGYETIVFKSNLKIPLITGIGETHPHEVSMVFDHNMGIPYIPASGIKGIVRFAHTLGLIANIPLEKVKTDKEGKKYFDDEEESSILQLFGNKELRGSIIFLDAYPQKVPDLHIDIMNPHYSDYYGDDTYKTPPADYLNPVPLKFLTVAKGTVFIFRVLVDKEIAGFTDKVKAALKKALTEEGVGAKTAVGYGIFDIWDSAENREKGKVIPQIEKKTALDNFITEIKRLRPIDAGPIGSKIDQALKTLETDEEKRQFAHAVRKHMGNVFKKSKAKNKLERFL